MWRVWMFFAALHGFLSVACGAFAAHGLKARLDTQMLANFETGARYEMYHALALVAVAWLAFNYDSGALRGAGWCFTLGTCVFSFSLYVMALTGMKWLGAITPFGGVAMLAGWVLLGYAAWSVPRAGR